MPPTDPTTLAVRAYATWCDLVSRLHRFAPQGDAALWWSARRTPDLVPDAVTLLPDQPLLDVVGRIHDGPGASVLDAYGTLDLTDQGWTAEPARTWIAHPPAPRPDADRAAATPDFVVVRERFAFTAWCRAWGVPDGALPVGLRRASGVTVLGRVVDDGFTDGAIVHRTVIGGIPVAGVWHEFGDRGAVAAAAAHRHPQTWLVADGQGPALDAWKEAGFTAVGPRRIWRRGP